VCRRGGLRGAGRGVREAGRVRSGGWWLLDGVWGSRLTWEGWEGVSVIGAILVLCP
jgi:hypothetical protein